MADKKYTREQAHDKIYSLAVRILARMDACSKCPIFKRDTTPQSCGFSKAWCCSGCPYLDPAKGGCQVEALACRLYLCADESARQRHVNPILRKRLKKLSAIACSYNILIARGSKEDALKYGETMAVWFMYTQGHIKTSGVEI